MANMNSWSGDWQNRIKEGLSRHGATSMMEFTARHPTWSYRQLAEALGEDIAPVQVESVERVEAIESGRLRDFAASSLVRSLRKRMPGGWGTAQNAEFQIAHSLGVWSSGLGEDYGDVALAVAESLKAGVPAGWLPVSPDDPFIVAALNVVELKNRFDRG